MLPDLYKVHSLKIDWVISKSTTCTQFYLVSISKKSELRQFQCNFKFPLSISKQSFIGYSYSMPSYNTTTFTSRVRKIGIL